MYFQDIIKHLNQFWEQQGCAILQGYDTEKGAATLGPYTFLKALDSHPWSVAYVDPCRRPGDARYGVPHTDRYQHYYQYQVVLKPQPANSQKIFVDSLEVLGINLKSVDLVFKEDAWESPVFGAMGTGWEIWLNGAEIAQLTYLQTVGGIPCQVIPLEITYGLERLALQLQQVDSFAEIAWNKQLTYGGIHQQSEEETSIYNLELSNSELLLNTLNIFLQETESVIEKKLVYPALDYLLKSAHNFNLLDSRQVLTQAMRDTYLSQIRNLATKVAKLYLKGEESNVYCD